VCNQIEICRNKLIGESSTRNLLLETNRNETRVDADWVHADERVEEGGGWCC